MVYFVKKIFTATNIYERGELSINARAGCSGTLRIQSDACSGDGILRDAHA